MKRRQFLKTTFAAGIALAIGPKIVEALAKETNLNEIIRVTSIDYSTNTLTVERFNSYLKDIFQYGSKEKTIICSEEMAMHLQKGDFLTIRGSKH